MYNPRGEEKLIFLKKFFEGICSCERIFIAELILLFSAKDLTQSKIGYRKSELDDDCWA